MSKVLCRKMKRTSLYRLIRRVYGLDIVYYDQYMQYIYTADLAVAQKLTADS